ncbi:hypothetical protein PAPYR_2544 [Paratrimastix pyriformis]|uniref:Uncharacterized protein n=1 Tax=Paratrimastix pyriformis TaxID=342808 RepID=A0ABQ8UPJ8_9EUKA|nr:hypothetical protein PAPYR_2544 [Paratrimastix pyriformis]
MDEVRRAPFRSQPHGPVGALIRLREKRWAPAVEAFLQPILDALIFTEWADERRFPELKVRTRRQTAASQVYDTRRNEPPNPNLATILRAIECDDPVVVNALIDGFRIEGVGLAATREEGQAILDGTHPNLNLDRSHLYQKYSTHSSMTEDQGQVSLASAGASLANYDAMFVDLQSPAGFLGADPLCHLSVDPLACANPAGGPPIRLDHVLCLDGYELIRKGFVEASYTRPLYNRALGLTTEDRCGSAALRKHAHGSWMCHQHH